MATKLSVTCFPKMKQNTFSFQQIQIQWKSGCVGLLGFVHGIRSRTSQLLDMPHIPPLYWQASPLVKASKNWSTSFGTPREDLFGMMTCEGKHQWFPGCVDSTIKACRSLKQMWLKNIRTWKKTCFSNPFFPAVYMRFTQSTCAHTALQYSLSTVLSMFYAYICCTIGPSQSKP